MADEAQTKPTIETILERINALDEKLHAELQSLNEKLYAELQSFREEVGIRLDRIESEVKLARSESLALRADFREFRSQYKQPA
jgi:hypothetical protein